MNERIVKKREKVELVTFARVFEYTWERGCGFAFDCDEEGNIDRSKMFPEGIANLDMCLSGSNPDLKDLGIERRVQMYTEPAVLKCYCGTHVHLTNEENDCPKCGQIWSQWGQAYKDRDDPSRYDDVDWSMEQEAMDYERM